MGHRESNPEFYVEANILFIIIAKVQFTKIHHTNIYLVINNDGHLRDECHYSYSGDFFLS